MKINVRKGISFEMVTTDVVVNVWSETRGQREKTRRMSVTLTYSLTNNTTACSNKLCTQTDITMVFNKF